MPLQVLALMGLRNKNAILQQNLSIVHSNLRSLVAFFDQHADQLQWCPPTGSSVAFPRLISGQCLLVMARLAAPSPMSC